MTTQYHTRTTHSLAYYRLVLITLIDGIKDGLTHSALAKRLNDALLPAPSGSRWSATSIKAALYKLRHPDDFPSRLYAAMTRLVFVGMLTREECSVLVTHRGFEETLL